MKNLLGEIISSGICELIQGAAERLRFLWAHLAYDKRREAVARRRWAKHALFRSETGVNP